MINKELEKKLIIGARILLGEEYCKTYNDAFKPGSIIELVEGSFGFDNGFDCVVQMAPATWNTILHEYDSIYHLFGNGLEEFMDCKILSEE